MKKLSVKFIRKFHEGNVSVNGCRFIIKICKEFRIKTEDNYVIYGREIFFRWMERNSNFSVG